jgi:3-oxoacyl-[acyl-carrier-protein] synthase-1
VIGESGEFLKACAADFIDAGLPRAERLRRLAALALESFVGREADARSSAVFLAIPDARIDPSHHAPWVRDLASVLDGAFPNRRDSIRVVRNGRSSFFFALKAGLAELASRRVDSVVIGGVDSLCDEDTLRSLDAEQRVLGGSSAGGLIPGEGAGFVRLERAEMGTRSNDTPAAAVLAAATGREAYHFGQEEPNRGEGLADVFQDLRSQADGIRADLCYTCETGEPFWTEEFALAYLRHSALMPEPFRRTMAAEAFGDLGVASGPVLLAVGVHALTRLEGRQAPVLLLCGSSDDGHVGGCLVQGLRST